ncbi:glycosyltransferase family 4 protein [Candidatus Uhrbacteria bacterium]|nr:glycosyltransferase family 4 protein [Candidatus Uhrbacteria bacterium]
MRIGIDARFYGPRVGGGGLGRYVAELVTHLQALDRTNSYVLFLRKENFHECAITNPNFQKRLVDVPWYTFEEQRVMPREVAHAKVHFMHYPHWNVPVLSRVPFVVTIHDLILLEDAQSARASTRNPFVHGIKQVGHRIALEHAVHRSKHIIAVSEYTKASLLRHFRVRAQKISVVPNGVGRPGDGSGVNLRALGAYEPYFLYVGNAYPHKNLEMMLHAFAMFRGAHPSIQLVIAGRRDVFSRKLETEASEIGIPSAVIRFVDLPTDDELAALYRHAQLFIYPSRIEGFGIPPLEAMTYGTPVAAARAASIPEILGTHARFFEPDDIEGLAEIMDDAAKRKPAQGIDQAKRHALEYRWERTAQLTLETYARIATRRV